MEHITYQMCTMTKEESAKALAGVTALAKVQSTKVFEYCAREAAQIFGGASYVRGGQGEKVERLYRDVRAYATRRTGTTTTPTRTSSRVLDEGVGLANQSAAAALYRADVLNARGRQQSGASRTLDIARAVGDRINRSPSNSGGAVLPAPLTRPPPVDQRLTAPCQSPRDRPPQLA